MIRCTLLYFFATGVKVIAVIVLIGLLIGYIYAMYRLLLRVKKSRRLTFLKIQLVGTGVLLIVSLLVWSHRQRLTALFLRTVKAGIESEHPPASQHANRCACTWDSMRLKRDDYAKKHRPAAIRLAADAFISDEVVMNELLAKGKLVPYHAKEGVRIQKLTHSEAFLHPAAAETFEELGRRFRERLSDSRESDALVVVSSVTRTSGQQKEILKRYPNSATKGASTHSYGASIDLLFVETDGSCYNARKALEKTLQEMQSEQKFFICPESKCIHLTAR